MQHLSTAIAKLKSLPGSVKESALPPSIERTLSAKNKQQLSETLSQICILQKAYGKTQAELETLVEGFSWALADYTMKKIMEALREYVRDNSDIPAPSDLRKIIESNSKKADFAQPTIEDLRRYHAKGIPLTPKQQEMLKSIC